MLEYSAKKCRSPSRRSQMLLKKPSLIQELDSLDSSNYVLDTKDMLLTKGLKILDGLLSEAKGQNSL